MTETAKVLSNEIERIHGEYDRLLGLLDEVVSGRIDPVRVVVDRSSRTWKLLDAFTPARNPALSDVDADTE